MQWLVIYTSDLNATQQTATVTGDTYTQAYINFMLKYDGIILELKQA